MTIAKKSITGLSVTIRCIMLTWWLTKNQEWKMQQSLGKWLWLQAVGNLFCCLANICINENRFARRNIYYSNKLTKKRLVNVMEEVICATKQEHEVIFRHNSNGLASPFTGKQDTAFQRSAEGLPSILFISGNLWSSKRAFHPDLEAVLSCSQLLERQRETDTNKVFLNLQFGLTQNSILKIRAEGGNGCLSWLLFKLPALPSLDSPSPTS